jgi:hypothetical protein
MHRNYIVPFIKLLVSISIFLSLGLKGSFPNKGAASFGVSTNDNQKARDRDLPGENLLSIPGMGHELSWAEAPGYCSSSAEDSRYERISGATLTHNQDGTLKLEVQISISNPYGCTTGEPCQSYDQSPEYVNAWIDWNGDHIWDASERVMDKALTGFQAIDYQGSMGAVSQFSPPDNAAGHVTWMRINLGWEYDPNDPCTPTWHWGHVVDQEIFLLEPQITAIDVVGISTTGSAPESGQIVQLEAELEIPPGFEIMNCSWAGTLPPGYGDPTNKCRYQYIPATGSGPSIETYGNKKASLTLTYKDQESGITGQTIKAADYKVFFTKNADDDGDKIPNWFEYWGEDGAVPGLNASDVRYNPHCPWGTTCYSVWDAVDDNIYLGDSAAETRFPGGYSVPSGSFCPGGNFESAQGIDSAAKALAHERGHETIYHNWDDKPGTAQDGMWLGQEDSDTDPSPHGTGDDLPDSYETNTLGTNANDRDSCNLAAVENLVYGSYGDNELDALRSTVGASGIPAKDWANPGAQAATPVISPITSLSRAGESITPVRYTFHPHPDASSFAHLTGAYSDTVVDLDGDGLFDVLRLHTGLAVDRAIQYYLVAWLQDGLGNDIAWASQGMDLPIGQHQVILEFPGQVLQKAGFNGSLKIARLELHAAEDNSLIHAADNLYTTSTYNSTDFDPSVVIITGINKEQANDSADSDCFYDDLQLDVSLNVHKAGTYTLIGELAGSGPLAVVRKTVPLQTGVQTVSLKFDGRLIYQHRQDGPYRLKALRVEDIDGERLNFLYDAYTTLVYGHDQFQHSSTTILPTSYQDEWLDFDDDGDYDYLRIKFRVTTNEGKYRVLAEIMGSDGEFLAAENKEISLLTGTNEVSLYFPAGVFYTSGDDGPYLLAFLALIDQDGNITDFQPEAYTTHQHPEHPFSPPLVTLTGKYQSYRRNTDTDTASEFLNIDIGLLPGEAGHVFTQGMLTDLAGNEIAWLENSLQVAAGTPQTITMSFTGDKIFAGQRDGPYQLRNLLVHHSADPNQSVSIAVAHTTSAYSYKNFGISPVSVQLNGSSTGFSNQDYLFSTTIDPANLSGPVTFTWEATDLPPQFIAGDAGRNLSLSWVTPGRKIVTVTVQNPGGSISTTHQIDIIQKGFTIYLPFNTKGQ